MNRRKVSRLTSACLCLIGMTNLATAAKVHDVHTHGEANLTLAYEGRALEVQLEAPAMNMLGFEHQPKTEEQLAVVQSTKVMLSSPTNVMSIQGASCVADHVDVEIHGPAGHDSISTQAHEHDDGGYDYDYDYDYEKAGEDHAHHKADEGHDGHHEERNTSHSEVVATYQFSCAENEKINSILVSLFEAFPNIESINVNWVTGTQQGQTTLRPTDSTIELK